VVISVGPHDEYRQYPPVFDLQLQQVVAGGRRVVDAEVALAEGVQEEHAHEPVVIAPIGAAAQPHRRHARNVAAVGGEGRAHEVILAVHAENAGRHRHQVPLPGDFAAAEDRVALGIDGLNELGARAAGRKRRVAEDPGRLPKDEVVVVSVIDFAIEAEVAVRPLQTELGAVCAFDFQRRVADVERAGCVVGAMGEELERAGRALNPLDRRARLHPGRQVLDQLEADA